MAHESGRDLRWLAKRYRITFKPPGSSDQWPTAHKVTFENIQTIGEQRFDSFCANIDFHSNDQPWRQQTKNRAEWLAKRAIHLFNQRRNEAGWRFGLENDVFRRFSFEVACPKCRARIWRSEVEAHIKESDGATAQLEERRRNRAACHCAPEYRPLDYYEIGTNPLFDDRTQEVILHDTLLRSELPKQEPDRVYGLQTTRNFEKLLSKPAMNSFLNSESLSVGEVVRASPFKEGVEPLLFPFLILEAKSEKSSNGFEDIQTQTAFPIMALLKLQHDLQAKVGDSISEVSSLVWFFANRGDAWRVYGCYVTADIPSRYDIVQLWSGSIMNRDDALSLLLIVDYVFDWARDVYRPSILRQLKSLAIGKAYDQVSLASDSDIISLGRNISNWIQPPPSTVDELYLDEQYCISTPVLGYPSTVKRPVTKDELGKLRPISLVKYGLSNEALADTCCILQPAPHTALQINALIHQETLQNTVSGEVDSATGGFVSWNIMLRLSAKTKDHADGFYFGRNKQRCDFVIGEHKRISKVHFKIFINQYGILKLEDLSRNGTAVDGVLLCGDDKENKPNNIRTLTQGSLIALAMIPPDDDYRFIVRIPERDDESENAYQKNLTAYFNRSGNVTRRKDDHIAAPIPHEAL